MHVVCHAQHLSGIGHFVRMHAIACGLSAAGHEVHLVEGGRPVPHARDASEPQMLRLPPLARSAGALAALGSTTAVQTVMESRTRELAGAVGLIRPDVLLIDHYPFSKWELDVEIGAAIDTARARNPAVRIICSLRDIVRQTRFEKANSHLYKERVLASLRERFDGILVHADPAFTRVEEHFSRATEIPIPVEYTGFVTHFPPVQQEARTERPYALLSCGGGRRALPFLQAAMESFRRLADRGTLGAMRLIVFAGAAADDAELAALATAGDDGPFQIRRFGVEFERLLEGSEFSISRAGYNTCAALLRSRTRAVLVPDPVMSDQVFRAKRFADRGLATFVAGDPPDARILMDAIETALCAAPPRHALDIEGVVHTRALVETVDSWSHP